MLQACVSLSASRGELPGCVGRGLTEGARAHQIATTASDPAGVDLELTIRFPAAGFYREVLRLRDVHVPNEETALCIEALVDGGELKCEVPFDGDGMPSLDLGTLHVAPPSAIHPAARRPSSSNLATAELAAAAAAAAAHREGRGGEDGRRSPARLADPAEASTGEGDSPTRRGANLAASAHSVLEEAEAAATAGAEATGAEMQRVASSLSVVEGEERDPGGWGLSSAHSSSIDLTATETASTSGSSVADFDVAGGAAARGEARGGTVARAEGLLMCHLVVLPPGGDASFHAEMSLVNTSGRPLRLLPSSDLPLLVSGSSAAPALSPPHASSPLHVGAAGQATPPLSLQLSAISSADGSPSSACRRAL